MGNFLFSFYHHYPKYRQRTKEIDYTPENCLESDCINSIEQQNTNGKDVKTNHCNKENCFHKSSPFKAFATASQQDEPSSPGEGQLIPINDLIIVSSSTPAFRQWVINRPRPSRNDAAQP